MCPSNERTQVIPIWLRRLQMETGEAAEELDAETHWLVNFRASGLFAHIKWIACEDHDRWSIWYPV